MKIAIGCDHIGLDVKNEIIKAFSSEHQFLDYGCYSKTSTHYPIYGRAVALAVTNHHAAFGIVICGTGIGIANAANRVKNARCALVSDEYSTKVARHQFNSNIIGFGALVTGLALIKSCIHVFLETKFDPKYEQWQVLLNKHGSTDTDPNFFQAEIEAWKSGVYTNGIKPEKEVELPKIKY